MRLPILSALWKSASSSWAGNHLFQEEFLQSLLSTATLRFLCGLSTKQCFQSDFTGSSFLTNISQQRSLGRFPRVVSLCKGTWAYVNTAVGCGCAEGLLECFTEKKKKCCQQFQGLLHWIYSYHLAAKQQFWTDFAIAGGFRSHGWFLTGWNVLITEKAYVLCEYILKVCMYIHKSKIMDSSSANV